MNFRNFLKSIGGAFRAKRYLGILPGNLPVNARVWSSSDFLNALEISLYTSKAVGKRADKVGEIEFQLKDKKGDEIENNPLLNLLYKPNKIFTGRQFWALYQVYYDTCGEVYILLERNREIFEKSKVTAMHLLNPVMVTPHFKADGTPEKFVYKTSENDVTYTPEQILYIHNPDPKHPLRGQSILKAGVNAIQTETQIATYHSRILQNGGKVEGVFKFKTAPLTEDQLQKVKDRYEKDYAQAKNSGKPLFLGGDADYVRTGLKPDELAFLEAKKASLEDICILTGVPKSMLASTSDVKFDNADADRSIFLRETIKPLLTILTTALDELLFPDDQNLTFVDPTPENVEQKIKETESGMKSYYLTINEARKRHGYDPIANGDEILVPFNLMPLSGAGAPELDEEAKSLMKENIMKRVREIHAKNTKEIDHPLRDAEIRRLYWNVQIKRMDSRETRFKKVVNQYFDEQRDRLVAQLQPAKTRTFRNKGINDLLNIELEIKMGRTLFIPVMTDLLKDAGVDAMEFAGSDGAFNLTSDISSWIEKRADIFLRSVNETTFKKLQGEFEESLRAEEGRDGLVNRIRETYGGIKKSRAQTIARTEVHNSTQYGTMQGYKQAGLSIKIWVAVLDGVTRDSHAAVDGEERPIDVPFSNGLMFPGDPTGSAEEVINCRCVI